jgi:hypothetical protein
MGLDAWMIGAREQVSGRGFLLRGGHLHFRVSVPLRQDGLEPLELPAAKPSVGERVRLEPALRFVEQAPRGEGLRLPQEGDPAALDSVVAQSGVAGLVELDRQVAAHLMSDSEGYAMLQDSIEATRKRQQQVLSYLEALQVEI